MNQSVFRFRGLRILLVALVAASLPAYAELYKWTDANGKVHYSDQPPPANVKQPVTVKSRKPSSPPQAATPDAAGAQKTYVEKDAEFRQRQVQAAESEAAAKKAAEEAAAKQKNCAQAKNQLANLQAGGRITRVNDKGEREYLNDAEVAQEIERTRQIADSWCK